MPKRLRLTRRFPVAMTEDGYRRLRKFAAEAGLDEGELVAFMQSINSVRLVLGTMLAVSDDPADDEVAAGLEDSPEYALYGYLSWLLEHCVRALS